MRRFPLNQYAKETVEHYIQQLPFFAELAKVDNQQYQILLQHSQIIELEPGEVLIEKGTVGDDFYSLVSGKLAIFQQRRPDDCAVCEIQAGKTLGALSIINHEPRTATVVVSSVEGATVISTDYAIFGEIADFSSINLATKRHMFIHVINQIREVIDRYAVDLPNATLTEELSTLTAYVGEAGSLDELEYLSEQAMALAWLLDRWNAITIPNVHLYDEAVIEQRLMKLLDLQ